MILGLEPFQNWVKVAQGLDEIASDSDLFAKKVCAKEIFGSNLHLASRAVRGEPVFPYLSALRAAESVGQKSESLILVRLKGFDWNKIWQELRFWQGVLQPSYQAI